MMKYFTTKNIENYKYELSVLKNKNVKNENEVKKIEFSENVIHYSKLFCRLYFSIEVLIITSKLINTRKIIWTKFLNAYLRINLIWILSNLSVNYYLENISGIKKLLQKYKNLENDNFEFLQYIQHKI